MVGANGRTTQNHTEAQTNHSCLLLQLGPAAVRRWVPWPLAGWLAPQLPRQGPASPPQTSGPTRLPAPCIASAWSAIEHSCYSLSRSQSRRSRVHSPLGSSSQGARIYIPCRAENTSPSETPDRLPESATWCPGSG